MKRRCIPTAVIAAFALAAFARAGEPLDLLKGAKWRYSLDGGATFTERPVLASAGQKTNFTARVEFQAHSGGLTALELRSGKLPGKSSATFQLNGRKLTGPMENMVYRTVPAIDAALLIEGTNVLEGEVSASCSSSNRDDVIAVRLEPSLLALKGEHLRLVGGPVLGAFTENAFTVFCRANMPAEVRVLSDGRKVDGARVESRAGLFHRASIPRAPGVLTLEVSSGGHVATREIKPPSWPGDTLRFVAMGDSRDNCRDWGAISEAALRHNPHLALHNGDLVNDGRNDVLWEEFFIAPAAEMLATTPFYCAIGNHERDTPLYDEMFITPGGDGRDRNWAQQVGRTLFIGVDGRQDWSAGGTNALWLESALAPSKAAFIFLVTHYPAWSSAGHGKVDEEGKPEEKPMRDMRETVMPLLARYNATAMIAGHDHNYERSEPDRGVTLIVTGGAGAGLRKKVEGARKQNPFSKVFKSVHHYCVFTVEGDTCRMQALDLKGRKIDSRTWRVGGQPVKPTWRFWRLMFRSDQPASPDATPPAGG